MMKFCGLAPADVVVCEMSKSPGQQVQILKNEIEEYKKKIGKLEDDKKNLIKGLEATNANGDKQILDLKGELTNTKEDLTTKHQEVKKLEKELADAKRELKSVGYHQTNVKQLNDKPDTEFYAGVIDIPSLKGLVDGWSVRLKDWDNYQQLTKKRTTIVSVIGNYSKGKTFLLEKLTGHEMPQGFNVNTQGISILYLKDEDDRQRSVIALDTKGGGNSLHINSILPKADDFDKIQTSDDSLSEKLRDHGATEDLLQNFILDQASIIIIVVADLTFDDQKLVNKIKNKYKEDSCKKIIVVHNLFHTHCVQDANHKIQNSILPSFPLEQNEFRTLVKGENETYFVDRTKGIIPHVILAKEFTEAGAYYNSIAIRYILDNISADDATKSVDIIQQFHSYLQDNLSDYMQADQKINKENIVLNRKSESKDSQPTGLKLKDVSNIRMKEVYADVFGDLQIFKDGFRPNYTLHLEGTPSEDEFLCLKIECPEECDKVLARIVPMNDEFYIEVKGSKGSKVRCRSKILDNRSYGDFSIKTPNLKRSMYGILYDLGPTKSYTDGMYIMKWRRNPVDPEWK